MNFQQDFQEQQSEFPFTFPEVQEFTPEYMPEVVSPCFIDRNVMTTYTKQNWLKKMLTVPKIAIFTLEHLEKVNNFASDVHGSVKKVENRVSVLEGSQGDFRSLSDRLQKVEMNATDITELKLQLHDLNRKNRIVTLGLIGLSVLCLGLISFLVVR